MHRWIVICFLLMGCQGVEERQTAMQSAGARQGPAGGAELYSLQFNVSPPGAEAEISGMADAKKGEAVLVGTFEQSLDLIGAQLTSAGADDAFVAKFDRFGTLLWSLRLGDSENQSGVDVAIDRKDNVYIVGQFQGTIDFGGGNTLTAEGIPTSENVFVAKLDAAGNHVWSTNFALLVGGFLAVTAVAVDRKGDVLVTGPIEGRVSFGGTVINSGVLRNYLVKFDTKGNFLWGVIFRGPDQQVIGLETDRLNNAVIVQFDVRGIRIYLIKWDPDGNLLLDRVYARMGTFNQAADAMDVDQQGNVVFAGGGVLEPPTGPINGIDERRFLAKLDFDGDPIWIRRFDDAFGRELAVDNRGISLLAGRIQLPAPGVGLEAFAAKFSRHGELFWLRRFGPDATITAVAASPSAKALLAGSFSGTVDFGGGPLVSGPGTDLFLAKLKF